MQIRTSSLRFQPYGDVYYAMPAKANAAYMENTSYVHDNKGFNQYYISNTPVYLECSDGIAVLVVSRDGTNREEFVMQRSIRLKPNIYYNIVAVTDTVTVHMACDPVHMHKVPAAPYQYNEMVSCLYVEKILTSYYNVRKSNFIFPGESNSYYELIYIDHGQLSINVEGRNYELKKYDLMVIYPGQFYSMHTDQNTTCSYLTIAFMMNNDLEGTLMNMVFHTQKDVYQTLSRFMKVIQNRNYLNTELAMIFLKEVLIFLYQSERRESLEVAATSNMQEHYENSLLNEILVYIHNNVYSAFTVEDLCNKFDISRSSLQALFRDNLNMTPKQYISDIKLNQAKVLIREHKRTISEISDLLGFTSIHYFSRKFKNYFGMTPTEFARSPEA